MPKLLRNSSKASRKWWAEVKKAARSAPRLKYEIKQRSEREELVDLMCEVLGRLLIETGQSNPQIVSDLDLSIIQEAAERAVANHLEVSRADD